ncbi:hypothetical protein [Endozoicomonas numazuensis]|uniref:Uncharacterized protein n=1 Tax=Endozoicomonas numazuensis TaxID=1137799 RepID=A0A081NKK3_9GAMM|nr:hypothetical protein [Endozoicomonas numazuensis]KEQ18976.1 hypothetical protein GZ78_02735 [Endozoicomonas numazuensis]
MSVQGPGNSTRLSPISDKSHPVKANYWFSPWSLVKAISRLLFGISRHDDQPDNRHLNEYKITHPADSDSQKPYSLPDSMVHLADQFSLLSQSRQVSKNDPQWSDTWSFVSDYLTSPAEPSSESQDNESFSFFKDENRNQHHSLYALMPDKKTVLKGDINETLDQCLEQYEPEDPAALKRQMTELCSQSVSNSLFALLKSHIQDTLSEDVTPKFIYDELETTTTFLCKKDSIEAQMVLYCGSFQLIDIFTSQRAELKTPVTIRAKITLPVNKPGAGSLEHLSIDVGAISDVSAL